jgi:PHS family inorganic phosphate transporter-like MFS transporter
MSYSDIAFYGVNLNQSIILSRIGYGKGATPYDTLWNTAVGNIIVLAAGYLPGYYLAILLPDWMGRVRQQYIGSVIVAILYAVWAGVTDHTSTAGLMVLFTLSQLFLNASCNATTWLIPTEVFPTRVRGTAHGLSAACGKCGAVLTAFAFGTITEKIGLKGVLGLFSGIMALVAIITFLIPETQGSSLDDIENETLFVGKTMTSQSSIANSSPQIATLEMGKAKGGSDVV